MWEQQTELVVKNMEEQMNYYEEQDRGTFFLELNAEMCHVSCLKDWIETRD